jgi:hypothetical protein
MILPDQVNLAEIAYLQHLANEEKEIQARIVKARALDAGNFNDDLATQTAKYLVGGEAENIEGINLMNIVLRTVLRRVEVQGVKTADTAQTTWLEQLWDASEMDIKQQDVHRWAERDGEAFIIVDYDQQAERPWDPDGGRGMPRFYVHERYTAADVTVGDDAGSGEGCKAHYRNNDYNQPLEMVSKRWTETIWVDGQAKSRQRMTLYIAEQPDTAARIEKYVWKERTIAGRTISAGWEPYVEDGQDPDTAWPTWWTDDNSATGRSLPLPVIHFRNEEMEPITKRLWGIQEGMDHAWSSLLGSLTQTAFRTLFVLGFYPTTDGKAPASDGSNLLPVAPGSIIGTAEKGADKASVTVINPADLKPVLEAMDKMAVYAAFVAGLPIQNFIVSRQISSAESLQQGESDLLAHANALIRLWGRSWAKALSLARRLDSVFGQATRNERVKIELVFAQPEVADTAGRNAEAKAQAETGVPDEYIWRNVWGFDEEQVREMKRIVGQNDSSNGNDNVPAVEGTADEVIE